MIHEGDVIAAIATPPGTGAIGIVRISGFEALDVLLRVFKGPFRQKEKIMSHRMYYGEIVSGGERIDEVMVCPMLAPRSYTLEDTVEIYAHGGMHVLGKVLGTVLENGARLAHPGEFTKRAFLNGRINLTEAEAVMDVITSTSDGARRAALRQLGGGLSERVRGIRDRILSWLAHIELSIDYPEHEEEAKNARVILAESEAVLENLRGLLETAEIGRILREGLKTAIIGRPNVGKSTLMNAILSEDRAIIHEQPGTTRDVLTESVRVGDVPLVIMDTAGIRDADDAVERIGVKRSLEAVRNADLVIYVADSSVGITDEDEGILSDIHKWGLEENLIIVLNKCDLEQVEVATDKACIPISAKTGTGLHLLYKKIQEMFQSGGIKSASESDIITRERHRILINDATLSLETAMLEIINNVPEDLVSISLRTAYIALGEILGEEVSDDIVDRIFMEFCVGK